MSAGRKRGWIQRSVCTRYLIYFSLVAGLELCSPLRAVCSPCLLPVARSHRRAASRAMATKLPTSVRISVL